MLMYAVFVLAITAIAGVVLASQVLTGKFASWPVSIAHALFGAAGLVILLLAVIKGNESSQVSAALGLLFVAALGGFFLVSFHIRKVLPPKSIVILHAGIAVIGFLTLLAAVLNF
jgi:predicted transporter